MRAILGWFGGKALLYLLLVLAIFAGGIGLAWVEQEIAATVATRGAVAGDIASAAARLDLNRQFVRNRRSIAACRDAEAVLRTHDTDWRWPSRIGLGSETRNRLAARRATACTQAERDVARTPPVAGDPDRPPRRACGGTATLRSGGRRYRPVRCRG